MKRLREIRQKMCMTQAMLADKVGLTRQAITAYESGNNFPGERELNKLADVLCVSVDELMGRRTKMVKYKIGDILENPWAPSNPYNKFVYMGVNGNFISIIRFDGKKIFLNKQGFYKNDILHPEWQHDPEGREFKVIGHSKVFELLKEELSSGEET